VQENTLVELDAVVVALADAVLVEVRLALDVIVDDEADVVKFAFDVDTEDVLLALELAVEAVDVMLALELAVDEVDVMVADELTEVLEDTV
jgi:hypothetical protein